MIKSIIISLILCLACIATYSNSLQNEFMLDDSILFNQQKTPDLKHIGQVFNFNSKEFVFYRPASHLVRSLLVASLPRDPFYYHLFNLLLFGIHVNLMFLFLKKLLNKITAPFIACLLYIVHPINGMMINYITAHEILLFVIALDLSILYFLTFLNCKKTIWRWASALFFALSLLIHETTIIFPIILLMITFQHKKGFSFVSSLKTCQPFLIIAATYFILRLTFIKHTENIVGRTLLYIQSNDINVLTYLNTTIKLFAWYLSQLIYPSQIVLIKNTLSQTTGIWLTALICLFIFLILFLIFRQRWKENPFLLALLWLGSGFICVFGISLVYPYNDFVIEPHWLSFSTIGFFLLIGLLFDHVWANFKNLPQRLITILLVFILTLQWFSITRGYNKIWKTQQSYCRYWFSITPDFYVPNLCLAEELYQNNEFKKAQYHYKKSLVGESVDSRVYQKLEDIQMRLNHLPKCPTSF